MLTQKLLLFYAYNMICYWITLLMNIQQNPLALTVKERSRHGSPCHKSVTGLISDNKSLKCSRLDAVHILCLTDVYPQEERWMYST